MGLKFGPVFHLGIAVEDVKKAAEIYEKELGIGPWEIMPSSPFFDNMVINGEVREGGLNIISAIYRTPDFELELIQPVGPGLYEDYLKEHGPGMHHVVLKSEASYDEVIEMAERISGRKPYLDVRFPDGRPLVAYADVQQELGLRLEIGAKPPEGELPPMPEKEFLK